MMELKIVVNHRAIRKSFLLGTFLMAGAAFPQANLPALPSLTAFPYQTPPNSLAISQAAIPSHPFSVVGPRGTVLGQQNGVYELWLFPWKVLSNMHISAEMKDYPVPIDVNEQASSIDVRPDSTIITYSHANFTIRQIIFAPKASVNGTGAAVFYEVEAVRPLTLTFSFTPIMQRMWPAESDDKSSPEWVKTQGGSGFYILHENMPDNAAAIAMPGAEPGILQPYQELARIYPLQFVLHVDPAHDANKLYPLLVSMGNTTATATREALHDQLASLDQSFHEEFEKNRNDYSDFQQKHVTLDTPDEKLNQAFAWAEISIDQLRVQTTPDHDEEALTAGFVGSGDTARPGFGWFFGRDGLWSLYAVNSEGDFATARKEFEFLLKRQSPDGKMPHEWSQTANLVDWKSLPYEYASADATLLLPMAMNDYMRISGDKDFVAAHWENLARAWKFECTHDTDGDGIYDNSEGSGWVESWIPDMPHQEIYLAALDEEASLAFANLARATGHDDVAKQASDRAAHIREQIEREYYLPQQNFYAFSYEGKGKTDNTATIFPSVAWWDDSYALDHTGDMPARWASSEFSTDWGTRIVSDKTSFYDPISYHQGTVWPLYTGWVSVAEYRTGNSLSAWAHLKQNADLTWIQDPGNTTELLSGQFFQPLGRSTAHQLWSSAMVVSPVLRGLFGLEWNVPPNELTVTPSLPPQWEHARIMNVPFGSSHIDLSMHRESGELVVQSTGSAHLASHAKGTQVNGQMLRIPLPAVEVGIDCSLPQPGSATTQMKVLEQHHDAHSYTVKFEAAGGSRQTIWLRINQSSLRGRTTKLHAEGVEIPDTTQSLQKLKVEFPAGPSYTEKQIRFTW